MTERELPIPDLEISGETVQTVNTLIEQTAAIGIAHEINVTASVSRKGTQMIALTGQKELRMEAKSVAAILNASYAEFIKLVAKTYEGSEQAVDAVELLNENVFASSCVTEAVLDMTETRGNVILNTLTGRNSEMVPAYYGSTDGLNFAEVLETIVCANELRQRGVPSYALFDTSGHQTARAQKNLADSIAVIPSNLREEFAEFMSMLGETAEQRRMASVRLLCPDENIVFVSTEEVFDAISDRLSVGRIALLAKLAGGDPKIVDGQSVSQVLAKVKPNNAGLNPSLPIHQVGHPNGFSMYAREVILAKDFAGVVAYPFKLTTHANVYKILGRYESLFSQRENSGALLCPIQRQRIQTRQQAAEGSDPCDVMVIAYLAQRFPDNYSQLLADFKSASVVLSPAQSAALGTADNRFVIQNYFPI